MPLRPQCRQRPGQCSSGTAVNKASRHAPCGMQAEGAFCYGGIAIKHEQAFNHQAMNGMPAQMAREESRLQVGIARQTVMFPCAFSNMNWYSCRRILIIDKLPALASFLPICLGISQELHPQSCNAKAPITEFSGYSRAAMILPQLPAANVLFL